jgi:Cu/Ag efflux pump CusA
MADAQKTISEKLPMPNEYTLAWSGEHEIISRTALGGKSRV